VLQPGLLVQQVPLARQPADRPLGPLELPADLREDGLAVGPAGEVVAFTAPFEIRYQEPATPQGGVPAALAVTMTSSTTQPS